ncbi:MAG: DUF1822 family protein [Cyanobacteria bacterium P01_A01_bin.37]
MSLISADPLEWWIELSSEQIDKSRSDSHRSSTPFSQHQSFLNHLCCQTFLPWLQANYAEEATIWPHPETLSSLWDVVSGTAITVNGLRIVLIPTDDIDAEAMVVPQEWVDIPKWAADYYVAIQIDVEKQWLRAWGYAAHAQIKHRSRYSSVDRMYEIHREYVFQDFNAFWVICQLCPEQVSCEAIAPLPAISEVAAERFIHLLMSCAFPRIAIPFEEWGWLIAHDDWRQRFYEQRIFGMTEVDVPEFVVNLELWTQHQVERGWHPIESIESIDHEAIRNLEFQPMALSFREVNPMSSPSPQRIKLINFAIDSNPRSVLLFMSIRPESEQKMGVVIQAHPLPGHQHLPVNLTLELRDHFNQVINVVRSHDRDNFIQFAKLTCPLGTRFSLHLFLEECRVIEYFIAGSVA